MSSPFTASSATLALKAGLCFLRPWGISHSSLAATAALSLGAGLSLSYLSSFLGPPQRAPDAAVASVPRYFSRRYELRDVKRCNIATVSQWSTSSPAIQRSSLWRWYKPRLPQADSTRSGPPSRRRTQREWHRPPAPPTVRACRRTVQPLEFSSVRWRGSGLRRRPSKLSPRFRGIIHHSNHRLTTPPFECPTSTYPRSAAAVPSSPSDFALRCKGEHSSTGSLEVKSKCDSADPGQHQSCGPKQVYVDPSPSEKTQAQPFVTYQGDYQHSQEHGKAMNRQADPPSSRCIRNIQ